MGNMTKDTAYVVVIGGANMDICGRPDAALVTGDSNVGSVRLSPGGVGRNIAQNLALLGTDVRLVTCFGEDAQADALVESCTQAGIDIAHSFAVPGAATSTYLYVTDAAGEMQLAINDMAILEELTPGRLQEREELIFGAAAVVVDTNVPARSLQWVVEHATAPVFCDPISTAKAHKLEGLLGGVHTLKPNRLEAELLSGQYIKSDDDARAAAQTLLSTGLQRVCLSLGADGVLVSEANELVRLPLLPCHVVNTTGAGDAMMAGLVWAQLQGLALHELALAGLAASALAVESEQTVSPHMSEHLLRERMMSASL